jgi:hypothetical protein
VNLVSAAQRRLRFLSRLIVVVALVLALLSSLVPFGFASAGHLCTMECCAGLAPHAAGSCHMNMSMQGEGAGADTRKPETDKLSGVPEANTGLITGVSAGVMGMTASGDSSLDLDGVTIDASEHCNTNAQSESAAPSRSDSSQPASSAAQSFSKPCQPECGTGALSFGVRPSRQTVALAYNARGRPPTLVRKYRHLNSNFSTASAHRKQVRPRGPPLSILIPYSKQIKWCRQNPAG